MLHFEYLCHKELNTQKKKNELKVFKTGYGMED